MSDINRIYRWHHLAIKVQVRGCIREGYDYFFADNATASIIRVPSPTYTRRSKQQNLVTFDLLVAYGRSAASLAKDRWQRFSDHTHPTLNFCAEVFTFIVYSTRRRPFPK